MNCRRPPGQLLHHFLLDFRGFGQHSVDDCLRRWQMQLIRRFNVRRFLKQVHQFRQIEKLGKPGTGAVARSFGSQLNGRDRFPEGAGPAVEVRQPLLHQQIMLQIAHHGKQLRHAVADRRPGGKHHAPAAGQLVQIAAFHQHVRGLLRFGGGKAGHVPHFGGQKQILVVLRFIHIQPVYAQLLKGYHIVLAFRIVEFL